VRTSLIALALGALLVGVAQGQDKAADQKRADAAAQKDGKLEDAVLELQKAAEAVPASAVFQSNLAYAYDRQGRIDDALAAYRKVLELDPANAIARNNLANLYSKKGLYEDAVREFEDVLQRDPANATARTNLENATRSKAIAQERQDQIAVALKGAAATPNDPRAAYEAARVYARLGDADNAFVWLTNALDLGYDRIEYLRVDPSLTSLKTDPRFMKLLEERRPQR